MGDDVVTVDIGFDRFIFDLVLARSKADGLRVWPLQMDDNGLAPGFTAMAPHKVLVRVADLPKLRTIVDDIQSSDTDGGAVSVSRLRRFAYRVIGSMRL